MSLDPFTLETVKLMLSYQSDEAIARYVKCDVSDVARVRVRQPMRKGKRKLPANTAPAEDYRIASRGRAVRGSQRMAEAIARMGGAV